MGMPRGDHQVEQVQRHREERDQGVEAAKHEAARLSGIGVSGLLSGQAAWPSIQLNCIF